MKELLTNKFWQGVKKTFDEAREGRPSTVTKSHTPEGKPNASVPAGTSAPTRAACTEPDGILFDMDGVLYDADRLINGAVETVQWVQSERIPHLFVTNTTSRSRADLVSKLASFDIAAVEADILTPTAAAAEWLRANGEGDVAAFVKPPALAEFADLPLLSEDAEHGAAYVVIGDMGDLWNYRTLNRAFRLLHSNPEAKLIALGMTRYWMAGDGIALDVAPFVVALEHASGRKALIFGKPSAAFFRVAVDRLRLRPGQVLMVGDDLEADVGGAQGAGLKAALVKTGKFRAPDLEKEIRPEVVFDSIAELPRWWRDQRFARPQTVR